MIDNKLQKLRLQNKTPIYIIRGSSESKSLILNKKGVSGFEKTIFVIIIFLVFIAISPVLLGDDILEMFDFLPVWFYPFVLICIALGVAYLIKK